MSLCPHCDCDHQDCIEWKGQGVIDALTTCTHADSQLIGSKRQLGSEMRWCMTCGARSRMDQPGWVLPAAAVKAKYIKGVVE